MTDFKFHMILRADGKTVVEYSVYQGDYVTTTRAERDFGAADTVYRRTTTLQRGKDTFDGDLSDDDLRSYYRKRLSEVSIEKTIPEQALQAGDAKVRPRDATIR